jgi:thymidylate synthase (FAD)
LTANPEFFITEVPPTFYVIGVSSPNIEGFVRWLGQRDHKWKRDFFEVPESISVSAGAVCYQSFDNKAGRSDADYLQQAIVEHKHESVLEHVSVNFGVVSLPRSVQLELVRHRVGAAYSFLSQRFTDKFQEFIVPPLMRTPENEASRQLMIAHALHTYNTYVTIAETIKAQGGVTGTAARKQAKEAARSVLGNNVGSDGVISYNARALRHVVALRTDPHADQSIREAVYQMYLAAKSAIPLLLQDAEEIPQEFGSPQVVFHA